MLLLKCFRFYLSISRFTETKSEGLYAIPTASGPGLSFWSRSHIYVIIAGPIFTKLAWIVLFMILSILHLIDLEAVFEP